MTVVRPMAGEPVWVVRRHPIRWWQHHLAGDYDEGSARRMRAHLAKVDLKTDTRWADAATGDAAAAVGLAYKYADHRSTHVRDLTMTALALAGLSGSAAACLVMAKLLRDLPGGDVVPAHIAESWAAFPYLPSGARRPAQLRS